MNLMAQSPEVRSQSNYMYDKITVRQRSRIFFPGGLLQTIMNHKPKERKERRKKKPPAPRVRGKIDPVFVVTFPAVDCCNACRGPCFNGNWS